MFMFIKQNVIELKSKEAKPLYSYYKKVSEMSIPIEKVISDTVTLKYHEATFYDSYISNILNPTGKFSFLSCDEKVTTSREFVTKETGVLYRSYLELG